MKRIQLLITLPLTPEMEEAAIHNAASVEQFVRDDFAANLGAEVPGATLEVSVID